MNKKEVIESREIMLNNYKIIKKIMDSNKINEVDKAYYVEMFVKHWYDEEQLKWLWENN